MSDYSPPVSALLKLGRPAHGVESLDYAQYGLGTADVPELIRLVRDEELARGDSDTPEVYAQIHAWRALGQFRAEAAIEPLLDLLAAQDDEEKWSDWTTEEVPVMLGLIGPVAMPAITARLERRGPQSWPPVYFAQALAEIARRHPETRQEVIDHLARVLSDAARNDPGLNGSMIADLLDLNAVEAWPAIEAAFATGNVDEMVAGDAADVKYELGLGPKPLRPVGWTRFGRQPASTAKSRAQERAQRRKAEKRKRKRGR